jgi:electron transport complex protein RnfE
MELRFMPSDSGVLLAILPPGGFLATGLVLVAKRMIDLAAGKEIRMAGAHSV